MQEIPQRWCSSSYFVVLFEWFEFCLVVVVQGVIPATGICAVFLTSLVLHWVPQIANPQWKTGPLRVSTPHYLNFTVMVRYSFFGIIYSEI